MTRARAIAMAVLLLVAAGGTGCSRPAAAGPELLDLAGARVRPLAFDGARAVVFVFTRTDCPISNRYAPELHRIREAYASRGVVFHLVYPDPDESPEAIREHLRAFGYKMDAMRDIDHALVALTGAQVTPEAAVFVPDGGGAKLVYHGRIDDRYVDFGRTRAAPTVHDLEAALDAILDGKPVPVARTTAVGCAIPEL